MDECKDCKQLLDKNENLLTCTSSRGKASFRSFLNAFPMTQFTAQESARALRE